MQIRLTPLSNSEVKASMTNIDSRGYNLLQTGSFLDDDAPVDKLLVHGSSNKSPAHGLITLANNVSQPHERLSGVSSFNSQPRILTNRSSYQSNQARQ